VGSKTCVRRIFPIHLPCIYVQIKIDDAIKISNEQDTADSKPFIGPAKRLLMSSWILKLSNPSISRLTLCMIMLSIPQIIQHKLKHTALLVDVVWNQKYTFA